MKALFLFLGILAITGCATVSTTGRPMDYYQGRNNAGSQGSSLFGDSADGLGEEAIQKVLSYKPALPSKNRVAILNLTQNNYWRYYSSDFIHIDEETVNGLVTNLKDSSRVYDASFLPSLLVPEKKTLPFLRAAAARYQADLLLTYRTNCQSFEKFKFIDPNVTRAYCTVEAVAIDIRSGIVPFTAVSTNEFTAEKKEQDVNFQETRKKAELKAINAGLSEVSTKLRKLIEGMPQL